MNDRSLRARGLALTLSISLVSAQALAEDQSQGQLEEVVVTAQKRSENLQNVPIAVSAISGDALNKAGVATTADLQFIVPALVYTQLSSYATPFLRGIGSDVTQPNADPDVATYVDGAFVSFSAGTIQNLLGVDHVEVLEGPQGTLYGRNAVAGAINVYTLTPTHETEANASLTLGNYNKTEMSARLSGGVTDDLAVGIYIGVTRRKSYIDVIKDIPDPDFESDHETQYGVRVKAVWTPTTDFTLTGSFEHDYSTSLESAAFRNVQYPALAYSLGAPVVIQRYTISEGNASFNDNWIDAATVREDWDLGGARFLGITSYRRLNNRAEDDLDGTFLPLLYSSASDTGAFSTQASQELQVLSEPSSPVQWIGGLYFFHEKSGYNDNVTSGELITEGFEAATDGAVTDVLNEHGHEQIKTTSYAGFAQATIPITNSFNLTLGARYTLDKKYLYPAFVAYTNAAQMVVLPNSVYPSQEQSWGKFTPKATLSYNISDTLLYATYSEGFKSGAYNLLDPSNPGPVNPETLKSYEIGSKSEFLDKRVRLNSAAYYYQFKDIQVQKVANTAAGITSLQNAAAAKAYGIEASLTAAATKELTLFTSFNLEHATYTSFNDPASYVPGAFGNTLYPSSSAAGNDLPNAPKVVYTVGANYKHELGDGAAIDFNAKFYHNSGFYWEATNRYRQDDYKLLDASVGYTLPNGKVSFRLYGTNLTNQFYEQSFVFLPISTVYEDAPPRMYGGTVSVSF